MARIKKDNKMVYTLLESLKISSQENLIEQKRELQNILKKEYNLTILYLIKVIDNELFLRQK